MPRFSVISVVRNDRAGMFATMRSVFSQQFSDYEYIVQDGASTDGTIDAVRSFGEWVDVFESSPDTGIYQAMNRAVAKSAGEYVLFLNAADVFVSSSVLERLDAELQPDDDIMYGSSIAAETGQVWKYKPEDEYWIGMTFDHQATVVRRELLLQDPFDESLAIAGDLDFFSRQRVLGRKFRRIGCVVASKPFEVGASTSWVNRFSERRRVMPRHFGATHPVEETLRQELLGYARSSLLVDDAEAYWKNASIDEILVELEELRTRLQ